MKIIDTWILVAMVLICFCVVVLTYEDYKKALASGNERRIDKDRKDLKEAIAILFVAIVCFILGFLFF
ncbi:MULTISPECIES: hypothetical protein [unclassified Campylobacter]|uniref:hypothetical protein n=1 Tax=unclassified Campylobacter TaxID=2593542 RepID=UPI001EFC06FD|nr:hypothetical protein [Campylobacter sp. RM12651]MBZ7976740.1 hypothetical protein [Campylobacter sp. RM12637]ULO02892.1 putative membrane protein [Campylobacter sp. RM12651]